MPPEHEPSADARAEKPAAKDGDRPVPAKGPRPPAWRKWVAVAAVLVLALGGWAAWRHWGAGKDPKQAEQRGPAKVSVEVAEAKTADLPIYLEGLGTVQAFNTVTVRPRVDGEIIEIAFQEGQMVQEGDLIARIDPRTFQAALDQAVAKKAQDEATLASNKSDLARTQQLATREFATKQQLDQQTATVGSASAQIAADQAQIDLARTQLAYTTIRAPISGRTGLRLVDKGNVVRAADTTGIVEIAQIHPIAVLFTAPEQQLPDIAKAMGAGAVHVAALSSDGKKELGQGTLALINNQVDQASGTVRLKATFSNDEQRLWPGLSVNTRLLVRTLKGVVTIPDAALQRGQNELFAFVVGQDGKAEKRVLKAGPYSEGQFVVEDGLKAGDKVVTAGQSRLQPGSEVEMASGRDEKKQPANDNRAAEPAKSASR